MNSITYKPIFAALFTLIFIGSVNAQKKEPYEMMVDGVKVIVNPVNDEIVQIQAVFKGGVQNYDTSRAGIEDLAIRALTECGTANDDKNSFKNKLDKVSGQIYGNAGMDFSTFNLNCIREDFDIVWPLYVDALTKPRFDEKEFNRIKQDAINSIKDMESWPDFSIHKLAKNTAFAGLNYAKDPSGTESSVKNITVAEAKDFYTSIATKSRMLFVVVANLDKSEIEQKIRNLLTTIPDSKPFIYKKERFVVKTNTFKAEKREFATNYLEAVASGPAPETKDYNAFLLAMEIFYDRNFLEIRNNKGLSYAPYAYFDGGLTSSANIGVSTTDPNKYIQVFNKLVDKTKKGFTEEEVRNMKTGYITRQYYKDETNAAQGGSLASNEIVHNNWRRAIALNEELKNISSKDVTAAFNKYITNLSWVYQGDPTKVESKLYMQKIVTEKLPHPTFTNKKVD